MNSAQQSQSNHGVTASSAAEELSRNLSLALMAASDKGNDGGPSQSSQLEQVKGTTTGSRQTTAAAAPRPMSSETSSSTDEEESRAMTSETTSISPIEGEEQHVLKKKAAKKDRSKLRKGKWTVEEEEYTTRIIHHFSTGLLTLPEGATLRSFLAEKLNCDPMRITKKFAGASCLGRRVFHLRNRPQPSYQEIQMARAELDRLEQRFRLRVEHGYGGMPLTDRPEMMLKFSTPAGTPALTPSGVLPQTSATAPTIPSPANNHGTHTAATVSIAAFLQNFAAAASLSGNNGNQTPALSLSMQLPSTTLAPQASSIQQLSSIAGIPGATQWLLPNAPAPSSSAAPAPSIDASVRAVNDAVTNWAWAQVAASLSSALPQLNATNVQQQQQQLIASLSSILPQIAVAAPNQQSQQVQLPASLQTQFFQQPLLQATMQQQQQLHSTQNQQPQLHQQQQPALPKQQEWQTNAQGQGAKQEQKKAHAEEANSFAEQLRQAYEKQLKLREEAEKKKEAETGALPNPISNKPGNQPKESGDQLKAKCTGRSSDSGLKDKAKVHKASRGSKDGKAKLKTTTSKNVKTMDKPKSSLLGFQKATGRSSQRQKTLMERDSVSASEPAEDPRTEDEEAAGSILLGFLSSLRDSYEDALRTKKPASKTRGEVPNNVKRHRPEGTETTAKKAKLQEAPKTSKRAQKETTKGEQAATTKPLSAVIKDGASNPHEGPKEKKTFAPVSSASSLADSYRQFTSASLQPRRNPPNYITDMSTSTSETSSGNNSTNPVESSLEDSDSNSDKCGDINSDKGKDNPSSSEEDDKVEGRGAFRSRGPPRKRIKSKKMTDEMLANQHAQQQKAAD